MLVLRSKALGLVGDPSGAGCLSDKQLQKQPQRGLMEQREYPAWVSPVEVLEVRSSRGLNGGYCSVSPLQGGCVSQATLPKTTPQFTFYLPAPPPPSRSICLSVCLGLMLEAQLVHSAVGR